MTKEELKKEAEGYTNKLLEDWELYDPEALQEAYIAGAEPREKRIAELEMTVGALRTLSNEQATCIESLKEQIEKMKRCFNCKYQNKFVESKCGECENYSKWEIKEKC